MIFCFPFLFSFFKTSNLTDLGGMMKMLKIASRHSRQKVNSIEISRRQTVTPGRRYEFSVSRVPSVDIGTSVFRRPSISKDFGSWATSYDGPYVFSDGGNTHGKALLKWPSILTWRCTHISCSLEEKKSLFFPFFLDIVFKWTERREEKKRGW